MKAVTFREFGEVEQLEVTDVPAPTPARGEVLVRNFATALNRADLLQRRGLYPPPPGESEILGLEFAGEIAALGDGVSGYVVGDRVFGLAAGGGYAEFIAVPASMAVPIPENLSYDAAAAIPEAFYTAHEALRVIGRLTHDETVLVHAGASGVGSAAIQLVRLFGSRAIATAGGAAKAEFCRGLGADPAIDYTQDDFVAVVERTTATAGVDVVLDLVGAKYFEGNLRCLAPRGRLLVLGLVGGSKVALDLSVILRRRLQIMGMVLRSRSRDEKVEVTNRFVNELLPHFESAALRPLIDSVYPIEEVREAHRRMEANQNLGKIVLRL